MESIGRGLIGLMALQKDKPEAQKIAQGLAVQKEGLVVKATLSVSADDVVELMRADAARKAAKSAQ
jgi:predicted regulator of Ras-like GTPase activity (Roadblock/LC7/MglB family)